MQIYFKRSGGFMGLRLQASVDTSSLPDEEAEDLESTLLGLNFFDLPPDLTTPGGADRFTYELTVVTYDQRHTIRTTDEDAPAEMQPLLRRLTQIARRSPPHDSSSDGT